MRLQALIFCAPHHRTEKDGFEFTAVVGEMTMRLAEDRNDLRHLETEPAVLVGERSAMTLRLMSCAPKSECAGRPAERRRLRGARCHSSRSRRRCRSDPR